MPSVGLGILLSLGTGFCWAMAPMFWSGAGLRIGGVAVNRLRMLMALATLSLVMVPYSLWRGAAPTASMEQAGWLALSGILHMAVGDAFYYEAIIMIGPRRAVQFLTLIPVSAVAVAWVWLGEAMTGTKLAGIAAVVGANSYLAWAEARIQHLPTREPGRISPMGVLCGVLAGLCIGGGAVFTRRAYLAGPLDPILGTTIRSAAATAVLWAMPLAMGGAGAILGRMRDPAVRYRMIGGTVAGPLVGMAFYVAALGLAPAGVVATLTSTSPLFILPMVVWRYGARITPDVIAATLVAVGGVAMIFW